MSAQPLPIGRVPLGSWPTPLEKASRLGCSLGLGPEDLWIKRDDLSGLGGGGNKVRKLELLCGAALADGADTLVTSGARQSNFARLTAAAGARVGLDVVLVLASSAVDGPLGGNLALDGLFGASIVWAGAVDDEDLDAAARSVTEQLRERGATPVLFPYGGSNVLGARGYVDCGRELLAQAPDLTTVVAALGSGGTMAGLVYALGEGKVLGVNCGAISRPAAKVAELVGGLGGAPVGAERLSIRLDHVGAGYGELTEPVMAALQLAAGTEGIVLDPIYTGRALAGLVSAIDDGQIRPGERTILLHSGGLPGLFGHPTTLARILVRRAEGLSPRP